MDITIQRDPLYVGRHGAHVTLGGIALTPDKAREVGGRLVLVADSFDAADSEPDDYDNGRLDWESSAADRDYQAAKEG